MQGTDDDEQRMLRAYDAGLRTGRSVRAVLSFLGEHSGIVIVGATTVALLLGDAWPS
jgi:hypothetical protein